MMCERAAAGMLPCIRYQKARVPPQPGQSKPVLNFTRQVGEVNASPLVGWSARVYATPPEKHTSTANGAAHRGLRAQNRNMNSLNRPPDTATCGCPSWTYWTWLMASEITPGPPVPHGPKIGP